MIENFMALNFYRPDNSPRALLKRYCLWAHRAKSNCTAVSFAKRKLLKENFILVFFCAVRFHWGMRKRFRREKVITRLYFSHYELESRENRIIAISPVKTKNRVESIESRDVWKQKKKIYRLLLYRGFEGWIWKVFAFNFTCVMCSAMLRFATETSQGKLNLFFSFSFLRLLCRRYFTVL